MPKRKKTTICVAVIIAIVLLLLSASIGEGKNAESGGDYFHAWLKNVTTSSTASQTTVTVGSAGMKSQAWGIDGTASWTLSVTDKNSKTGSTSFKSGTGKTVSKTFISDQTFKFTRGSTDKTVKISFKVTCTIYNKNKKVNTYTQTASITVTIPAKAPEDKNVTVTYKPGSGATGSTQTETKTTKVGTNVSFTLKTPSTLGFSKPGYKFTNWTAKSADGEKTRTWDAGSTQDLGQNWTLTANWEKEETYTVTYINNGAEIGTQTKTEGESVRVWDAPSARIGYTFLHWDIDTTSTSRGWGEGSHRYYPAGSNNLYNGNQTLTAHWQKKIYTLAFQPDGGTFSDGTTSTKYSNNIYYQETTVDSIPAPVISKRGYTFGGWSGSSGYAYNSSRSPYNGNYWEQMWGPEGLDYFWTYAGNSDSTYETIYLSPTWNINTSKVYIDYDDGGSTTDKTLTCTYLSTSNNKLTALPTREGYRLDGFKVVKINDKDIDEDVLFYDALGNAVSGDYWSADGTAGTWNLADGETVYLKAVWTKVQYGVRFYPNENNDFMGVTGKTPSREYEFGKSYQLPANGFKTEGKIFNGWKVMSISDANGSTSVDDKYGVIGKTYKDQETVKNLTSYDGYVINMYALWKDKKNISISSGQNNSAYTGKAETQKTATADAQGKLSYDYRLGNGDKVIFSDLPGNITQNTVERGFTGYTPSFAVTKGTGPDKRKSDLSEEKRGADLWTGLSTLKDDTTIAYTNIPHEKRNITVKKTAPQGSQSEEFEFKAEFRNLSESAAYTLVKPNGEKLGFARAEDGTATVSFTLKKDEEAQFIGLDSEGEIKISEDPKEYTAEITPTDKTKNSTGWQKIESIYGDKDLQGTITFENIQHNEFEITKKVTGNRADIQKDFGFTIKLEGAEPNRWYLIDAGHVGRDKIVTDSTGKGEATEFIRSGGRISIKDLPDGCRYTISEDNEDYEKSYEVKEGKELTDGESGTMRANKKISYTYTNTKNIELSKKVLRVDKKVTGTAADKDNDSFLFDVSMKGLEPGSKYYIDGSSPDSSQDQMYALFAVDSNKAPLGIWKFSKEVVEAKLQTEGSSESPEEYIESLQKEINEDMDQNAQDKLVETGEDVTPDYIGDSLSTTSFMTDFVYNEESKEYSYTLNWMGDDVKFTSKQSLFDREKARNPIDFESYGNVFTGYLYSFSADASGNAQAQIPLKDSQSFNLRNAPVNAKASVSEEKTSAPAGYHARYNIVSDSHDINENNNSGTIPSGKTLSDINLSTQELPLDAETQVTFTNSKFERGTLKIGKEIEGEEASGTDNFDIRVHAEDAEPDASYPSMEDPSVALHSDKNGEINQDITFVGGRYYTFNNLPSGITYTVNEKGAEGYVPSYAQYSDTISEENKVASASGIVGIDLDTAEMTLEKNSQGTINDSVIFTNTKSSRFNLYLSKEVDGTKASKTEKFNFTVSLKGLEPGKTYAVEKLKVSEDEYGNEETTKISNESFAASSDGTCEYKTSLADAERANIVGLPKTTTYKIKEESNKYTPFYKKTLGSNTYEQPRGDSEAVGMYGSAEKGTSLSTEETILDMDSGITFVNTRNQEAPVKVVSDDDDITKTGTGEEKNVKENTVKDTNSVWTYDITQDYPDPSNTAEFYIEDELPRFVTTAVDNIKVFVNDEDKTSLWNVTLDNDEDVNLAEVSVAPKDITSFKKDDKIRLQIKAGLYTDVKAETLREYCLTDDEAFYYFDNTAASYDGNTYLSTNKVTTYIPAESGGLSVAKNVKGSLGDITKKFEFSTTLSGLTPGKEYRVSKPAVGTYAFSYEDGKLKISVKDQSGSPVKGAVVLLYDTDTEDDSDEIRLTTGDSGTTEITPESTSYVYFISTEDEEKEKTGELRFSGTDIQNDSVLTGDIKGTIPISAEKQKNIKADSQGKATFKTTLKDNEKFSIVGIPKGARYEISEAASDHVPSFDVTRGTASAMSKKGPSANTVLSTGNEEFKDSVSYVFTNTRNLHAITGNPNNYIFLLIAAAAASAVMFVRYKGIKK